ncbi:hypothetical protein P7K49_022712 [Saguinus oedipus]|uniref:Uncharacterized protein n=1 Tax=Saguinus oedipus TaxID=9490 RepID=A0ABQ9UJM4_SAGOE|nr:hypothetical protein P7K49_022712 [Saguinus oedipus]
MAAAVLMSLFHHVLEGADSPGTFPLKAAFSMETLVLGLSCGAEQDWDPRRAPPPPLLVPLFLGMLAPHSTSACSVATSVSAPPGGSLNVTSSCGYLCFHALTEWRVPSSSPCCHLSAASCGLLGHFSGSSPIPCGHPLQCLPPWAPSQCLLS